MNAFQQAYAAGKQAAEVGHGIGKLVPPGKVTAASPTPSATLVKSPTTPGGGMTSAPAPSSPFKGVSSPGSTIPSLGPSILSKGPGIAPVNPQALTNAAASQGAATAIQFGTAGRRGSFESIGAPLPGVAGSLGKTGAFNMGMTPDPSTKPDHDPKADNGPRVLGTSFTDPPGPLLDINSAWNALSIPKNTDVLNEAGQAEIGAPSGMIG